MPRHAYQAVPFYLGWHAITAAGGDQFCYVRSPVNHIYLLLGELSTIAELSLATNSPENLQRRGVMHLQRDLKDKVAMMNRLQLALEHNRFS